jgi:hypothetical protein
MSYKEPGVYLSVVAKQGGNESGVQMLPCVIGPGAKLSQKTIAITRGATTRDAITVDGTVDSISQIADYSGGPAAYTVTTDYSLTTETVTHYVTWVAAHGPAEGEIYYVTFLYAPGATQYDVNVVYGKETLISMYGDQYRTFENNTPVNYLSLAGQMMFDNGASKIIVCQIASAAETPTKTEFEVGLAKLALDERVWRIVPTHVTSDIIAALKQHLVTYSAYEERKERRAIITVPYDGSTLVAPTAFSGTGGVLDVVGDYATNTAYEREILLYPDTATITMNDGVRKTVGGQMLAAAFAGAEAAQKPSKSRTRMTLGGIYKLNGVSMTRAEMNALAPTGVTVLTQGMIGGDVTVRHGVTTDFTSTETREISIGAVSDYCAKNFRNSTDQYIGKYEITNELLTMIKGTLESKISTLIKEGSIIDGKVMSVVQDADNPDAVAVAVRVFVPYPCNYIDITMYLA